MVSSELSDGSAARIGSQGNLNLCHKVIIEQRRKGCQRDLDLGNRVGRQEGRKEASKEGQVHSTKALPIIQELQIYNNMATTILLGGSCKSFYII